MKKTLIGTLAASVQIAALGVVPANPPTRAEMASKWELPEEFTYTNDFRSETILNGFWLRTDQSGKTEEVRVPGAVMKAKKDAPPIVNKYYREVVLPEAWRDRYVTIEFSSMKGSIYVNGEEIAESEGQRFMEYEIDDIPKDGKLEIEVHTDGIANDVYLRSRPQRDFISDSYLQTSFRNQSLNLTLEVDGKQSYHFETRVADNREMKRPVKEFDTLEEKWSNPKYWTPDTPNLYYYTVTLFDSKNNKVDELLPRRFGFREFWIENGQLMLNGIPTVVRDDTWEQFLGRGVTPNYEQTKVVMESMKKVGINGGLRAGSEIALTVADEVGILVPASCGSFVKINIWDPKSGLTPMTGEENKEDVERIVKRLREHPCIPMWSSSTAYSLSSMHPEYAGQYFDSWNYFPLNRSSKESKIAQDLFLELVDMMRDLDSTREVSTGNGPYSKIERSTRYLCDNLDIQEREEFFDIWFRTDSEKKAIWTSEFAVPFMGHEFIRYIDHQMPQGGMWPKIHVENAARDYGEEIYLEEPDSFFGNHYLKDRFSKNAQFPVMQKRSAENIKRIYRAWRTYGISFSGHFIMLERGYGPRVPSIKFDTEQVYGFTKIDDPRRPGASYLMAPTSARLPEHEFTFPAAQSWIDNMKPVMGYIGGADTKFTNKDHLYYSGSEIRKAFVVINDTFKDLKVKGEWKLLDANNKEVEDGKFKGVVQAGQRALEEFTISCTAPAVDARTDYTLVVEAGEMKDTFAVTVFPSEKPEKQVAFSGDVWMLNISDDYTHESMQFFENRDNYAMLEAVGIHAKEPAGFKTFQYCGYSPAAVNGGRTLVTNGVPKATDLLIIPRQVYRYDNRKAHQVIRYLESINFDQLVEDGLRVVMFEQDVPNVMGMNTESSRPRKAFIAAQGHPVFDGLTDSDLRDWSGASTLQDGVTPYSRDALSFPERIWNTSNVNAVGSRVFVRPQTGANRALAVSGFDLQETPLLETVRGKGRILFCQFDVTSRYGKDPVATKLVDNIFKYITTVNDANPVKSEIDVLVADGQDVISTNGVFRMAKPEGQAAWGITQGELFSRESIYTNNRPTKKLPNFKLPIFAGTMSADEVTLPQVIRKDEKTGRFQTTISPDVYTTGWMKRKAAWIQSALKINQGGSSLEGPRLELQGNVTKLYPYEWIDGFVHPYTSNIW